MIPWTTLFICLAAAILIMLGLWFRQRQTGYPAVVDVFWAFMTSGIAVALALMAEGPTARKAVAASLIGLWGLRLGTHLARRYARHPDDSRYVAMKERWNGKERYMLGFFMLQALACVIFALPVLAAATGPEWSWPLLAAGLAVALIGKLGVHVSDQQLRRYLAVESNRGGICRNGLWSWSRHPNYFFEWVFWCSWPILAADGPLWYLALAGMLLMLFFLLKVSGIPHVEREALRKRGDAWREYQASTNAFIPWPPRRGASS